ncbi:MAG: hypothetical protein FD180_1810 [Planctomycetota bacterium]|nr:MAG: hypothetical protein FD180_1810 [Planctomycetota bacterium]
MHPRVSEVLAGFAAPLGLIAEASAGDLARLEALVGPIPEPWAEFLRGAGASTGNLRLRGQHTDLGLSLAEDVLPVLEKKRKKEAAKGLKLAPVAASRFMIAMPRGTCQDCGPVWLELEGGLLPAAIRKGLEEAGSHEAAVVQVDEGGPRGKRSPAPAFVLGESLAAWLFDAAFRQFRLAAAGPPQRRSVRPEHAAAPRSLLESLGRAAIAEGFRRHELSRFVLTSHFTRNDAAAVFAWNGNAVEVVFAARTPALASRLGVALARPH